MAKATQLKALTYINLPFIERSFAPGQMIDRSEFEEYAEAAADAHAWPQEMGDDHSGPPNADDVINQLIEFGSLSDDPNANLHPDHIPVEPGKPTLAQIIEQARGLVQSMDENGQDVPDSLRELAEQDYNHVIADGENGKGGDNVS